MLAVTGEVQKWIVEQPTPTIGLTGILRVASQKPQVKLSEKRSGRTPGRDIFTSIDPRVVDGDRVGSGGHDGRWLGGKGHRNPSVFIPMLGNNFNAISPPTFHIDMS